MTSEQNTKLQDLVSMVIYKWFGLNFGDLAKIAKPKKTNVVSADEIQQLCKEIGEKEE